MKGTHRIIVKNRLVHYDFVVRRNITIIRGDSASGKTTLVDMLRDVSRYGHDSGVMVTCDKPCVVLDNLNWQLNLSAIHDSIVFIDEGSTFVHTDEFAVCVRTSDNYYIIVTREAIHNLPYSWREIYGIRHSGKYGSLKPYYHELYHIYPLETNANILNGSHLWKLKGTFSDLIHQWQENWTKVITEDSHAGYEFFVELCRNDSQTCLSSDGKSNIHKMIVEKTEGNTLIVADGAAFGSELERVKSLIEYHHNIYLYLPESFEWLILKAGLVAKKDLAAILKNPSFYIESQEYFSWEQFFTDLLIKETNGTYLAYSKNKLNPNYLHETVMSKIMNAMFFTEETDEQ